jgi:hypothetical protein
MKKSELKQIIKEEIGSWLSSNTKNQLNQITFDNFGDLNVVIEFKDSYVGFSWTDWSVKPIREKYEEISLQGINDANSLFKRIIEEMNYQRNWKPGLEEQKNKKTPDECIQYTKTAKKKFVELAKKHGVEL